jgi:hypothetical protein
MTMRNALAAIGVAVSIAAVPAAGYAGSGKASSTLDEWTMSTPSLAQRQDVREVSLPRPPYGPATPHPFCTPAQPICP